MCTGKPKNLYNLPLLSYSLSHAGLEQNPQWLGGVPVRVMKRHIHKIKTPSNDDRKNHTELYFEQSSLRMEKECFRRLCATEFI